VSEATLSTYDAPGRPRAMVLVLHGGKPRSNQSVDGRSASWRRAAWLAREIAPRAHAAGVGIWLVRYRRRGWNGGTDAVADARWALDRVRAVHGDVPVVLLGHSMGARVAVHAADDPSVVGVVGLAPWWSADDPVATLAGRALRAAHGRRDRITSFKETTRYVERARSVADSAGLRDMGALGHYMLTGSRRWHDVAIASVLEVLDAHSPSARSSSRSSSSNPSGER
jgi:alpha-beta hydrolase superfamily lysophospholipase